MRIQILKEKKVQILEKKVEEGFSSKEGPFVKALDIALQSFGVHRQNYMVVHLWATTYTRHFRYMTCNMHVSTDHIV